jgi:S-formylglutathione hydrolase FrmB
MATMTGRDKLRTLLPHWIEHNADHATDFRLWAGVAGEAEADIEVAAAQMEAANEALAAALAKLGGPLGNHDHHHHHSTRAS